MTRKDDLATRTAWEVGRLIQAREISTDEAACFCLRRTEQTEPALNAFISRDMAITEQTRQNADRMLQTDMEKDALTGVPMGLKDNICTPELPTTCGSHMLAGYRPPYDATAWQRLRDHGAVLIGKLNMDEFAMGSTNETSWYGAVKNPHDLGRTPGGSSGGCASAVAAGQIFYALGSDTGGSVRQPAAYCGVTGMKPTYGRVSRYGLVAYASSLDQIGILAGDALSCAAVLKNMAGPDGFDSQTKEFAPLDLDRIGQFDGKSLRIGLPDGLFGEGLDPAVQAAVFEAASAFEQAGASVEPVKLPGIDLAIPAYYVLACAEAASNLSRFDGVKYGYRPEKEADLINLYVRTRSEGFGEEVKRRLLLGNFVLSSGFFDAYYRRAVKARDLITRHLTDLFGRYDVLLCPTTPDTAPLLGSSTSDPLTLYLKDIFTVIPNLSGLPAISIPCGQDAQRLPVGFQMIGRWGDDETVLGAAAAYQQWTDHHRRRPSIGEEVTGHEI